MACVQCGKATCGRLCAECKGEGPTLEDMRRVTQQLEGASMSFGESLEAADPGGVNRRRNLAALDQAPKAREPIWYVVYTGREYPTVLSVHVDANEAARATREWPPSFNVTTILVRARTAIDAAAKIALRGGPRDRTAAQQASDVAQLNELAKTLSEGSSDQGALTYQGGSPMFTSPGPIPEPNATIGESPSTRVLTFADIEAGVAKMRDDVPSLDEMQVLASGGVYTWLLMRSEAYEAERKARLEAEEQLSRAIDDLGIAMAEQIPGHCKDCGNRWDCLDSTNWCQLLDTRDTPPDGSGFCWKFKVKP